METDFTKVAKLLANPARSAMVAALFDCPAMTVTELAQAAGVGLSTASEHLSALAQGGLVRVAAQGRHRYFALAGSDVAEALEALSRICPPTPARSLRASIDARTLGFARTCYDHLAGTLGVALLDALLAEGWLSGGEPDLIVSPRGHDGFADLGIDVSALGRQRRSFARPCLDYTARRPHLAGALGAAVTAALLDRQWIKRESGRRAILLTSGGAAELGTLIGLQLGGEGVALRESAGYQPGSEAAR